VSAEKWFWDCTEHGGLRESTWNLLSSNGDVVLKGVKGVELVKNDKYTKLVRSTPNLLDALEKAYAWFDSTGHVTGLSEEIEAALVNARGAA
jgi:hypothetical protein